ncbi:MAG: GntR family transcriptional regulator [Pseudomonadota bacterium]
MGSNTAKATAGDRVYYAIKASVIAYEFAQGQRIYLEPIAESLGVSTTPVREALNRLAAEGLVIKAPRKGFIALTLNAKTLLGHYELTKLLLVHELEGIDGEARKRLPECEPVADTLYKLNRSAISSPVTLAVYTGRVFRQFASLGGNSHVIRSIERANDHLHYIRTVECRHLQNIHGQLVLMCELLLGSRCEELLETIESYHDTRIELLPDLLDLARR